MLVAAAAAAAGGQGGWRWGMGLGWGRGRDGDGGGGLGCRVCRSSFLLLRVFLLALSLLTLLPNSRCCGSCQVGSRFPGRSMDVD